MKLKLGTYWVLYPEPGNWDNPIIRSSEWSPDGQTYDRWYIVQAEDGDDVTEVISRLKAKVTE